MTTREDLLSRLARARALRDAAPGVLRLMIGDDDSESVVEYSGPLGKWSVTDSVDDRVAAFLAASHDHVQLAEDLAAALEQAEEERDAARQDLARCYVLAGWDPDGNTPETGWIHLYSSAVEAVAELRQTYDDGLSAMVAAEKAADELAALRDERDRLARMLACERGEPGSAPGEGWVPGPGGWAKPGGRGFDLAMVYREDMTWYVYDEHGDGVTSGTCTTMLEAIEAADAALEADRAR